MAQEDLVITEGYDALTILKEAQLNAAMTSIETFTNVNIKNNFEQLVADIMPPDYELNNDGAATLASPLSTTLAGLADNETVTGSWTFSGTLALNNTVTSTSTLSSSGQPRARAYRSASNQSLADVTLTAISLGAESYDVASMHDNSTNPSRLTIPAGGSGVYSFEGQVCFATNSTGRREVRIHKNGSEIARAQLFNPSATESNYVHIAAQDTGTAGDYYEMVAYQSSGGALDVVLGERVTFFSAMKVW